MSIECLDDAALVARIRAGDTSAFGLLIDRHRPGAMLLAQRLLENMGDAEDVVQDALLQAFLGLRYLRAAERFGPWLFGIVINLCRLRWRGALRQERLSKSAADNATSLSAAPAPEDLYETRALHKAVLDAIATLPQEQQHAVQRYYLDGLPVWEISLLTNVPVGTLKSQLHRARAQLRLELERLWAPTPHARAQKNEEGSS